MKIKNLGLCIRITEKPNLISRIKAKIINFLFKPWLEFDWEK